MLELAVAATAFGLVFLAELPDKTALACLLLGTRFRWWWAFAGIAAAFASHVAIAVAAGSLLTLLPHRVVAAVVGGLFLVGAVLIWREGRATEQDAAQDEAATGYTDAGFLRVAGLSYGVIFLAEWGDLTQILTANLAAKYDDPVSVAIGAVAGLWAVGLLAILGGKSLLALLPIRWITWAAATVMTVLGAYSLLEAVRG